MSVSFGLASTHRCLSSMTANTGVPAVTIAAELDRIDLRGDAGNRRAQHGVIEIALGLIERSGSLHVGRIFLERQIRIAEKLVAVVALPAGCNCSS